MDTPQKSQLYDSDGPPAPQSFVTGLKKQIVSHGHVRKTVILCGAIITVNYFNLLTKTRIVKAIFELWILRYPTDQPNDSFNANTLSKAKWRFIVNKKKFSDVELDNIKLEAKWCLSLK